VNAFKVLYLPLLGLALSGCASMSEQECLVSDWRTVGFEDGAAGRPVETIGSYRETCAKHGVAPDLASYRAGHEEGLASFCQPSRGFEVGRRGGTYRGVCPSALEVSFLDGYNEGRHLYTLESAVRSITSRIAQNNKTLDGLKKETTSKEAALISDNTTAEQRVTLLAETKELARRQGELEAQILELERQRVAATQELNQYAETLAFGF
jgi:Protein of unknown function (DUF2799)